MAPPFYARKAALVLGAMLGLFYGLSSQLINSILSPGIPFAHHPFGLIGNCIASILGMTLVCFICCLPKDTYRGATLACLSAFLVMEVRALAIRSSPLTVQLFSAFSLFALIGLVIELAIILPIMLILRWTIEIQAENFDRKIWVWQRARLPLAFLAAVMALSIFSVYPSEVLDAMANSARTIDSGLRAAHVTDLPAPLRNENNVQDFLYHATAQYELELGDYQTYLDPKTLQAGYAIDIVARFKGGWAVVCRYNNGPSNPKCQSFDAPHAPPVTDYRAQVLP